MCHTKHTGLQNNHKNHTHMDRDEHCAYHTAFSAPPSASTWLSPPQSPLPWPHCSARRRPPGAAWAAGPWPTRSARGTRCARRSWRSRPRRGRWSTPAGSPGCRAEKLKDHLPAGLVFRAPTSIWMTVIQTWGCYPGFSDWGAMISNCPWDLKSHRESTACVTLTS